MIWSEDVLKHIHPATENSFANYLSSLVIIPQNCWEHCLFPEEQGLEIWIKQLFQLNPHAAITAAAATARYAYPIMLNAAGDLAMECGLHEDSPSMDGASEGMKIRQVEGWLLNPTKQNFNLVRDSIDPTRQLEVWDEDLYPAEDVMWWWFMAVGQLCAQAVVHGDLNGEEDLDSSYTWASNTCAARCAVTALKTIRKPDGNIKNDVQNLGKAIAAAFGL